MNKINLNLTPDVDYLFSPQAIRDRCGQIFKLTEEGKGDFQYLPENWEKVTDFVYETILEKYPTFEIPFHSRLGHFRANGIDRLQWSSLDLNSLSPWERIERLVDLIVPSVLLDAGSGPQWQYSETQTQLKLKRSEGLGVASFYLFTEGKLSTEGLPLTDSQALQKLTIETLKCYFQVTSDNPLVGIEGRLRLLHRLGEIIEQRSNVFPRGRPSDILQLCRENNRISATKLLKAILQYWGPIWPSRFSRDGVPLGDTWSHPALGPKESFESLVPFHKLSQWLTYSILDACQANGIEVQKVEELTGLPEYRNGGLFLDLGLFKFKDPKWLTLGMTPDLPVTIEWRALTVFCLDNLAQRLQTKLNLSPQQFPLAKVLEGGSWWAGRKIAAMQRPDGSPPMKLILDGTVF